MNTETPGQIFKAQEETYRAALREFLGKTTAEIEEAILTRRLGRGEDVTPLEIDQTAARVAIAKNAEGKGERTGNG